MIFTEIIFIYNNIHKLVYLIIQLFKLKHINLCMIENLYNYKEAYKIYKLLLNKDHTNIHDLSN